MNVKQFIKYAIRVFHFNKIVKANIVFLTPNKRLENKKVVITGGSRGLGYSMAKKFVNEGADVLITGVNNERLILAAEQIGCRYLKFDVTDFNNMDDFLLQADRILGGIDTLVNNAGISLHEGNIRNVKIEQFDRQIDVNLKACYFLSQKFILLCEKLNRKNVNILFLSSERGQHVDDLPYGIIKGAINSLTQGLAKMLIRENIRVNAIAPGITATDMTGRSTDNLFAGEYSTGRYYLPEEVAEIACFLISDAANCISGQIIYCNNGKSINYRKK